MMLSIVERQGEENTRSTAHDVAHAVLQVLARYPNGEAPIATIVKAVPDHLKLTDEDR